MKPLADFTVYTVAEEHRAKDNKNKKKVGDLP
jgi:hypothetical protein